MTQKNTIDFHKLKMKHIAQDLLKGNKNKNKALFIKRMSYPKKSDVTNYYNTIEAYFFLRYLFLAIIRKLKGYK